MEILETATLGGHIASQYRRSGHPMRMDTTQSLKARRARDCAAHGTHVPTAFALFHDHARLPWRFHALLNVSNDILVG